MEQLPSHSPSERSGFQDLGRSLAGYSFQHNSDQLKEQERILQHFRKSEQEIIQERVKLLTPLSRLISKDFAIPVLLNAPGRGWFWNAERPEIRVDPKDLLEKPLSYSRFAICHEGAHHRISRLEMIPKEQWQAPGFAFLMNANEDPRINNFAALAYPQILPDMLATYDLDAVLEQDAREKLEGKTPPRYVQAGFEYLRLWNRKIRGKPLEIRVDLPEEVQDVVRKTLPHAEEAWSCYPTRDEANRSEKIVRRYADEFYDILVSKIWPEFSKLVQQDLEEIQQQKNNRDKSKGGEDSGSGSGGKNDGAGGHGGAPSQGSAQGGAPNQGSGQKSSQSAGQQGQGSGQEQENREQNSQGGSGEGGGNSKDLKPLTEQELKELEQQINEQLQGKWDGKSSENTKRNPLRRDPAYAGMQDEAQKILRIDETSYHQARRQISRDLTRLEGVLKRVFDARRKSAHQSGHRRGKKIDIRERIKEVGKEVHATDTRAYEQQSAALERDFSLTLLADCTGSMEGQAVREQLKGAALLSESLNKVGVRHEVLGFNSELYVFKSFGERLTPDTRSNIGSMIDEVKTMRAFNTDDGWALRQASERLGRESSKYKFIIMLTDGISNPSPSKNTPENRLEPVLQDIKQRGDQVVIGIGLGPSTGFVDQQYPNGRGRLQAAELTDYLETLLENIVKNFDSFRF